MPDFVNNIVAMKILIIRFSSIGDLTQALSIPGFLMEADPKTEVHFATRQDLATLAQNNPHIAKVWELNKDSGIRGLFQLIQRLRQENFTHVYDAHNNLRSFLIRLFLIRLFLRSPKKLVRPMYRLKRFLLLNFHINLFEKPFSGQRDLIKPLEKWNYHFKLPPTPQIFLDKKSLTEAAEILSLHSLQIFYVLVPSAAYELKRWPVSHWQKLIEMNPDKKFVVLAGKNDLFTAHLNTFTNVVNLTGKTTLLQSAAVISKAAAVVSNDTGLLHIAEQLGRPAIALMGPAPFGFPSRPLTVILEKNLKCRPCSKHGQGPCTNPVFQDCLRSISPELVSERLQQIS